MKEAVNEEIDKAKEEAIARPGRKPTAWWPKRRSRPTDKADARKEAARVGGRPMPPRTSWWPMPATPSPAAAQVAAQKLKEEADKKEQQFIAEADKAEGIVASARAKGMTRDPQGRGHGHEVEVSGR